MRFLAALLALLLSTAATAQTFSIELAQFRQPPATDLLLFKLTNCEARRLLPDENRADGRLQVITGGAADTMCAGFRLYFTEGGDETACGTGSAVIPGSAVGEFDCPLVANPEIPAETMRWAVVYRDGDYRVVDPDRYAEQAGMIDDWLAEAIPPVARVDVLDRAGRLVQQILVESCEITDVEIVCAAIDAYTGQTVYAATAILSTGRPQGYYLETYR